MKHIPLLFAFLMWCSCKSSTDASNSTTIDTISSTIVFDDSTKQPLNMVDTITTSPSVKTIDTVVPPPPPSSPLKPKQPTELVIPKGKTPKSKDTNSPKPSTSTQTPPTQPVLKADPPKPDKPAVKPIEAKVPDKANNVPKPIEAPADIDHSTLTKMYTAYVDASGMVNYRAWKKDRSGLDQYLAEMSKIDVNKIKNADEKLAYLCNVYNAVTIKLILDHYPVRSIQDIAGGKPWDMRIIQSGNTSYTLNEWEHGLIKKMGRPRFHFAINCAAKSCPPLSNKAFDGNTMDNDLRKLTTQFVNDPKMNNLSITPIKLSKIFEWYAGDFGDVIRFISDHTKTKITDGTSILYNEYDWALNERK
jgi:hypothetical protein